MDWYYNRYRLTIDIIVAYFFQFNGASSKEETRREGDIFKTTTGDEIWRGSQLMILIWLSNLFTEPFNWKDFHSPVKNTFKDAHVLGLFSNISLGSFYFPGPLSIGISKSRLVQHHDSDFQENCRESKTWSTFWTGIRSKLRPELIPPSNKFIRRGDQRLQDKFRRICSKN